MSYLADRSESSQEWTPVRNHHRLKVMESEEALKYYLDEVKDAQNDINNIEEEVHLPNGKWMWIFIQNFGLCVFKINKVKFNDSTKCVYAWFWFTGKAIKYVIQILLSLYILMFKALKKRFKKFIETNIVIKEFKFWHN